MSDTQITVGELINQLQECPPRALVDVQTDGDTTDYEFKIAEDVNLQVIHTSGRDWVTLRGFR